ncbi:MAG TPA: carbonic anhydrase [Dehalococcoidia bacterium]|jgi:carbonic anhydrase
MIDELLGANARYASSFAAADAPSKPRLKLAVVTCMDARIDPAALLGLAPGDAHVIRNAGGRADESAIRSLVVSYKLLGTREFVVIHHESCGMLSFTNDELRSALKADLGADASDVDFMPFTDLDQSVRDDVRTLRESPLIPGDIVITGFVYDVRSGRLREVR